MNRIREILPVKISAQLPGINSVIRNSLLLNQLLLNSVVGTDIGYLKNGFPQRRQKRYIRCNMTGCPAARQNDLFTHPQSSLCSLYNTHVIPIYSKYQTQNHLTSKFPVRQPGGLILK